MTERLRATSIRVGMLAPPWPIPARSYGGVEAVIDGLCRGLVTFGAEVFLWSARESTCPVTRGALFSSADLDIPYVVPREAHHILAGYKWLDDQGVHVVHDHTLVGPLLASRVTRTPVVATPHLPLDDPDQHAAYSIASRQACIVAVSRSQARAACDVSIGEVVHHGIDLERYVPGSVRNDAADPYLLFLGRMSPQKGVAAAIRACRAARARLMIAARMEEVAEHAYFTSEVEPLLDDRIRFIVELEHDAKIVHLQRAAALINPVAWEEPFGLVMIEALACGCPVLAFERGAVGEIVNDGHTGWLCRSEADLVERVVERARGADGLSRAACRRDAEARFGLKRMAADYLNIYCRVSGMPACI